jgi:CHAT domain-containing protein
MHALASAGARASLVTLWRVYSDAAMRWTVDFYARLRAEDGPRRATPSEAFQQATLALRALSDDVVAWAPFVLVGDAG